MAATLVPGPRVWSLRRDAEGNREYWVTSLVRVDPATDGPAVAIQCPQLPQYGDIWNFSGGAEIDIWAWRRLDAEVQPAPGYDTEKTAYYHVENVFSTKPVWRCGDNVVLDPLLEPYKFTGSFNRGRKSRGRKRTQLDPAGAPSSFMPLFLAPHPYWQAGNLPKIIVRLRSWKKVYEFIRQEP